MWNVSNVLFFCNMFESSKFNGDLSQWNVSNMIDMSDMFFGCPLGTQPQKQPQNQPTP